MSDSAPSPDKLSPAEESRVAAALALGEQQAAQGDAATPPRAGDAPSTEPSSSEPASFDAGAEPSVGGAADPGAEAPPPNDERITRSQPPAPGTITSELIEVPVQGAAVERGDAVIPSVDAQPVQPVSTPEAEPNKWPEHPATTVQRMRMKLAAYGEECLKAVQGEVEYLEKLTSGEDPLD